MNLYYLWMGQTVNLAFSKKKEVNLYNFEYKKNPHFEVNNN